VEDTSSDVWGATAVYWQKIGTFFNLGHGTWIAALITAQPCKSLHVKKRHGYSGSIRAMTFPVLTCITLLTVALATPLHADARSDAMAQVDFGITVAQRGLWREAIYRWEKAVEIDPTYAAAYNDLAVGYEHEGQLEKARQAYDKALALEPNNAQIRQNYDLFKEINDRTDGAKETP
jgi:tetratricopeptide (TPR) repeat protein